jgi:hypothetical protein
MTFDIMTLFNMAFSKTTLNIAIIIVMELIVTLIINRSQRGISKTTLSIMPLSIMTLIVMAFGKTISITAFSTNGYNCGTHH